MECAPQFLAYGIRTARNLIWALLIQALLNDNKLPELLDDFGVDLGRQADFRDRLISIGKNRILPVVRKVVAEKKDYKQKLEQEKYAFLRQKEFFRRCMNVAED
jgi:hypothetical protein